MTRWLLSLLFLLLAAPTWAATGSAAVDTWYVRPTGACANNGDGLAYACAAGAGETGAFLSAFPTNLIWTPTTGIDNGDTLYVCGLQDKPLVVTSDAAATPSLPITIDFRCPSDPGTIRVITDMTEALTAENWTNESGSLWYLSVAGYTWKDPRRLWIDSVEQFPASAKVALGTHEGTTAPLAQWWYDSGNSRLYFYAAANPATTMSLLESLVAGADTCAYTTLCMNSSANKYITIINPTLLGGQQSSLYILGGNHITIYGTASDDSLCHLGGYARRGPLFTDTTGSGTGTASSYLTVHDCTIDPLFPANFTGNNWEWQGSTDGVNIAYGTSFDVVQSNTIRNWGHGQVNIDGTVGTTTVTDNLVADNTMVCTTTEYCRGFLVDGNALNDTTRNVVRSNTIDGQSIRTQVNGNGNTIAGNVFRNQRPSAARPTDATEAMDMEGYAGPSQDNLILNNTFLNNVYGPCLSFRAGNGTKSGYVIQNNLFVNCGGPYPAGYENQAIVLQATASVGDQTFTNNVIYDAAQTATVFYKATGATTVAGFQTACSGDVCTGNVATNPLVLTTGQTEAASPARRAGIFHAACIDVRGRPCWTPPDIGGYQATHGDLVTARTAASARAIREMP